MNSDVPTTSAAAGSSANIEAASSVAEYGSVKNSPPLNRSHTQISEISPIVRYFLII